MSTNPVPQPFTPPEQQEEPRNWTPIIVGLVLVVIVVAGIAVIGRNRTSGPAEAHPYSEQLRLGEIRLSAADNFVGSTMTYLDVPVTNAGDKTIVGGQLQAEFKNNMGELVQKETLPLHVLQQNQLGGYADVVDVSMSPLGPGQTKTFRMTLEHVSSDWDRSYPALKFLNLKLK